MYTRREERVNKQLPIRIRDHHLQVNVKLIATYRFGMLDLDKPVIRFSMEGYVVFLAKAYSIKSDKRSGNSQKPSKSANCIIKGDSTTSFVWMVTKDAIRVRSRITLYIPGKCHLCILAQPESKAKQFVSTPKLVTHLPDPLLTVIRGPLKRASPLETSSPNEPTRL